MAFVLAPLARLAGGLLLGLIFTPRAEGERREDEPLSTDELDAIARGGSSATVPLAPVEQRVSADAGTAFLTEAEIERMLAPAAPSSTPILAASSTPAAPSSTELAAREALARELLAPSSTELAAASSTPAVSGEVMDSPETAARKLYRIATTIPAAQRGPQRQFIAAMQRIIGVQSDGLIGRGTALRVRELTGLRIPGLA